MKRKDRAAMAEMYDRLNSNLWLADKLADKLRTDLAPTLGDKDPFQDYCAGRITERYFNSLHPVALHLVEIRNNSLRVIAEIEERETDLQLTTAEIVALQVESRELTNLTIESYDSFVAHIMRRGRDASK